MAIFADKYRIESTRLKEWDYSNAAWYYVTINTKGNIVYFGDIKNDKMVLNEVGSILNEEWLKTSLVRQYVELDVYQIMPNHFHAIIIINNPCRDDSLSRLKTLVHPKQNETMHRIVSTTGETCHRHVSTTLKPDSLGSIIGQFKSICTKRIHGIGHTEFSWQPRFYDHIIRNDKELYKIRKYILDNPQRWQIEKDNIQDIEL